MSRRNIFNVPSVAAVEQPALKPVQPASLTSIAPDAHTLVAVKNPAIRALDRSFGKMSEAAVTDIDPALIDDSFITDRMEQTDEAYRSLVKAIREQGQQVPIMVRPSPHNASRYQVVYGRRRLRAARELGLRIKAMVKDLNDTDLVVVQGQENSARADLSFIERALFALRLEARGFTRDVIQTALTCDRGTVSTLISVAKAIPQDLIDAIGPAHGVGKPRWIKLSKLFKNKEALDAGRGAMDVADFAKLESKARFGRVSRAVEQKLVPADRQVALHTKDGAVFAKMTETRSSMTFVVDKINHPAIASYLAARLPEIVAGVAGREAGT